MGMLASAMKGRPSWSMIALAVLALGCGSGGTMPAARDAAAGLPEIPAGAKRVILTCCDTVGLMGEGWILETGQVTADTAEADFRASRAQVISLFPNKPQVAFCDKGPAPGAPRYAHVGEVPSETASCTSWGPAYLGGDSSSFAQHYPGQAFVVRNRNGVPVAKLLTVSASTQPGLALTFDIIKL
jgi:hypothetical protein